jgi:zinc protease
VDYACDPQNVSKARAVVERDLKAMQTAPVSADDLRQAKAMLLRQIPLGEASVSSIAGGLMRARRLDCRSMSPPSPRTITSISTRTR